MSQVYCDVLNSQEWGSCTCGSNAAAARKLAVLGSRHRRRGLHGRGRLSSGPSWQQDAHPSAPWQRWHRQAQGELGRCIQGQIRRQAQKEEAQIGERGRWHPQRDRGTQARVTRRELVCHVIATRRHTLCNYMIGGSVRTPIFE